MTPRPNDLPVKTSSRPPFDDEDADIIFRSSDDVYFRLYKVILAKASPVFRTMLQLPQPSSTTPSAPDELHVVKLTEDAKTLENLLRLCYPVEHPNVTSVDDVYSILEAARKYEIASVTANLRWAIKCILPREPLRMYAIAYMFEMEDVTREAANLLLDVPQFHIPPLPPPEFNVLPCVAIYAVHTYRQKCVEAALHALAEEDWSLQSWVWTSCNYGANTWTAMCSKKVRIVKWFEVNLELFKATLKERPSARTVRSFPTSEGASEALSQAASCSNCAAKAHPDLVRFSEWLVDKVDDAIAKVRIELPFSTGS